MGLCLSLLAVLLRFALPDDARPPKPLGDLFLFLKRGAGRCTFSRSSGPAPGPAAEWCRTSWAILLRFVLPDDARPPKPLGDLFLTRGAGRSTFSRSSGPAPGSAAEWCRTSCLFPSSCFLLVSCAPRPRESMIPISTPLLSFLHWNPSPSPVPEGEPSLQPIRPQRECHWESVRICICLRNCTLPSGTVVCMEDRSETAR